jgi:hypothetical protein
MDSVELSFNHGFWGYFLTLIYLARRNSDLVSCHNMGILIRIRNHDLNLKLLEMPSFSHLNGRVGASIIYPLKWLVCVIQ